MRETATTTRVFAAIVTLSFLASPLIFLVAPGVNSIVTALAALAAVPLILSRFREVRRLLFWVVVFCVAYLLGSLFADDFTDQGISHVISTATAAGALLVFATFGRDLVASRAWVAFALSILGVGAVAITASDMPKNIMVGTALYLVASALVIVIARREMRRPLLVALLFSALAAGMAFVFDFRGLIGYAAMFLLAYVAASIFPRWLFAIVGAAAAMAVVIATTWLFLSYQTDEFAAEVIQDISNASGRRAASGRDVLWANIIYVVDDHNPWVGMGAGALPRDFMPTDLSSHSYFMQVFLQMGWIGLGLLAALLVSVWRPLARGTHPVTRFAAAIFLVFVAHNATEVLMFQNGLIAGIPAWCCIGLGLAYSRSGIAPGGSARAQELVGVSGRRSSRR